MSNRATTINNQSLRSRCYDVAKAAGALAISLAVRLPIGTQIYSKETGKVTYSTQFFGYAADTSPHVFLVVHDYSGEPCAVIAGNEPCTPFRYTEYSSVTHALEIRETHNANVAQLRDFLENFNAIKEEMQECALREEDGEPHCYLSRAEDALLTLMTENAEAENKRKRKYEEARLSSVSEALDSVNRGAAVWYSERNAQMQEDVDE